MGKKQKGKQKKQQKGRRPQDVQQVAKKKK